ncbi:hypothetical protein ONS95_010417 [Cadophora gregata]|uniref:uncharacterized protein n=1 Tax=Cadophora gregata TaxID=51156 RepID=UPI0026DC2F1B|nr:uncharacterized protein ONS95_010417 [Cadophora gregata]KAK0122156.1 hypothetical protein ONS95_010417 [Cadophora gregata]KAK0127638.1 hypothetical protein ONS96_007162 [Cadophora gregata f. sp. sojae]
MLATLLLLGSALVAAEPAPYKLGSVSKNPMLGLGRRQDAGYSPTQTYCGPGTDCASSCGATYITCASTDDALHCYDPSINESCCPDGTGNSCSDGYFCTSDTSGNTWCCPNGMDLVSCAAAYSLTDSLVSQVATVAPTAVQSSTPTAVSAKETPTYTPGYSSSSKTYEPTLVSNVTYTPTTTAGGMQFTGGADHVVFGGLKGLALAAGALLAF